MPKWVNDNVQVLRYANLNSVPSTTTIKTYIMTFLTNQKITQKRVFLVKKVPKGCEREFSETKILFVFCMTFSSDFLQIFKDSYDDLLWGKMCHFWSF